jgi:hypothetical protein
MPLSLGSRRAILSAAGALGLAVLAGAPAFAGDGRIDPVAALRAVSRGTAAVLGVSAAMGAGVGVVLAAQHRRAPVQAQAIRQIRHSLRLEASEGEYRLPPPPPVYGGAWEEPAYADDFTPLQPEPGARSWREENAGALSDFGFPPRRGPTRSF